MAREFPTHVTQKSDAIIADILAWAQSEQDIKDIFALFISKRMGALAEFDRDGTKKAQIALQRLQEAQHEIQACWICDKKHVRSDLVSGDGLKWGAKHAWYCRNCTDTFQGLWDAGSSAKACLACRQIFVNGRGRKKLCPSCETKHKRSWTAFNAQILRTLDYGRPVTLTFRQWIKTLDYFNYSCVYCGEPGGIQLDHFISLRDGGGMTADNCVPACRWCNTRKTSRDPRKADAVWPGFFEGYSPEQFWERLREIEAYLKSRA